MSIKKTGKNILCNLLEAQVRRLRKRSAIKIVAVAGSVGKTSTKLAIAKTLSSQQSVIYQDGNYNDRVTVPLVFFNQIEPGIFNVPAWLKILIQNERTIRRGVDYEMAVLELGTDGPGQMKDFAYLEPDILVLTSIAEEHMEYFKTLDAVADEELVPLAYAKRSLLNIDDIDSKYLPASVFKSYGYSAKATYRIASTTGHGLLGQTINMTKKASQPLGVQISSLGKQGAKVAVAAAAVADMLGWDAQQIKRGLQSVGPVAGRMQILNGIKQSTLIDDTYNASPIAVKAALDVLYATDASQRIAILGTMNELGDQAIAAHKAIGDYCDPTKLDLVLTIGQLAADHLAPAAVKRGCQVMSFTSPTEAGTYVAEQLDKNALVLIKGSQNGVFAEEALKPLLKNKADSVKLVRQSKYWLGAKRQQFSDISG